MIKLEPSLHLLFPRAILIFGILIASPKPAWCRENWPQSSIQQSLRSASLQSPFPIAVVSEQQGELARVAISAVLPVPYPDIRTFAGDGNAWCEGFFTNIYVKACYKKSTQLSIYYANNSEYQPLPDAYRFDYRLRQQLATHQGLSLAFYADSGPLSSWDYRIRLEAEPHDEQHSRVRFVYQMRYGLIARSALFVYLKTLGSGKKGFSRDAQGEVIEGVRGILERNAMRYLLALSAYFQNSQAGKPLATSLKLWHDYARVFQSELDEVPWQQYQALKLREYRDQQHLQETQGVLWLDKNW